MPIDDEGSRLHRVEEGCGRLSSSYGRVSRYTGDFGFELHGMRWVVLVELTRSGASNGGFSDDWISKKESVVVEMADGNTKQEFMMGNGF